MVSLGDGSTMWGVAGGWFDNVVIDVDVTKVSGDDENEMGIICRHQDEENFYVLSIGTDGSAHAR